MSSKFIRLDDWSFSILTDSKACIHTSLFCCQLHNNPQSKSPSINNKFNFPKLSRFLEDFQHSLERDRFFEITDNSFGSHFSTHILNREIKLCTDMCCKFPQDPEKMLMFI